MKKFTILKAVVAASIVSMLVAGSALAAPAGHDARDTRLMARLTLVHGVPGVDGFPVDISLYGFKVGIQEFNGVTFGTVAGPIREAPRHLLGGGPCRRCASFQRAPPLELALPRAWGEQVGGCASRGRRDASS